MEIIIKNEFKLCKLETYQKIYHVPYFLLKNGKIFNNYFSEYDLNEYSFELNNYSDYSVDEFINLLINKYINYDKNYNKNYEVNIFLEILDILYKYEFNDLMIEYFIDYYFNIIHPKINNELINLLLEKYNFDMWKNENNENIYDIINKKILNQEINFDEYYKNFDISYFNTKDSKYQVFLIFNNLNINLFIVINIFNNYYEETLNYFLEKYELYKNNFWISNNKTFLNSNMYIYENNILKKYKMKNLCDVTKNFNNENLISILFNILNCNEKDFDFNCQNFYLIDSRYVNNEIYKILEKINNDKKDIINDDILSKFKYICEIGDDEIVNLEYLGVSL